MTIVIVERNVTVDEFIDLRSSVGWNYPNRKAIYNGLVNTEYSVCIEKDDELIGYGRIIGDGGIMFYIQDVIVKPKFQNLGIGKSIMNRLIKYLRDTYLEGVAVGLFSAKGKENFYKKFGFIERPNETFGAGMIQYLKV